MKKCNASPSAAVPDPPWKARGPKSPLAMPCNNLTGLPQRMNAAVISNTAAHQPPHRIAGRICGFSDTRVVAVPTL